MPTISGSVKATDTLTFSGVGYYRRYKNRVVDGNVTEIDECATWPARYLCLEDDAERGGDPVSGHETSSSDDRSRTSRCSRLDRDAIERLRPPATAGAAWWKGKRRRRCLDVRTCSWPASHTITAGRITRRRASSATFGQQYVVNGSGVIVGGPLELAPRDLDTENTYWGLYFSNALDVTDRLTVTVGGRYNHATIKLDGPHGSFPRPQCDQQI